MAKPRLIWNGQAIFKAEGDNIAEWRSSDGLFLSVDLDTLNRHAVAELDDFGLKDDCETSMDLAKALHVLVYREIFSYGTSSDWFTAENTRQHIKDLGYLACLVLVKFGRTRTHHVFRKEACAIAGVISTNDNKLARELLEVAAAFRWYDVMCSIAQSTGLQDEILPWNLSDEIRATLRVDGTREWYGFFEPLLRRTISGQEAIPAVESAVKERSTRVPYDDWCQRNGPLSRDDLDILFDL